MYSKLIVLSFVLLYCCCYYRTTNGISVCSRKEDCFCNTLCKSHISPPPPVCSINLTLIDQQCSNNKLLFSYQICSNSFGIITFGTIGNATVQTMNITSVVTSDPLCNYTMNPFSLNCFPLIEQCVTQNVTIEYDFCIGGEDCLLQFKLRGLESTLSSSCNTSTVDVFYNCSQTFPLFCPSCPFTCNSASPLYQCITGSNWIPDSVDDWIWFNANIAGSAPAGTFLFTDQHIILYNTCGIDEINFFPQDSCITVCDSGTSSSVEFVSIDPYTGTWNIQSSVNCNETFLGGLAVNFPFCAVSPSSWKWCGLLVGPNNISVEWQIGASAYTNFSLDNNQLNVSSSSNPVCNSQQSSTAGVPYNYLSYIKSGATGDGGDDYVGNRSDTSTLVSCNCSQTMCNFSCTDFFSSLLDVTLFLNGGQLSLGNQVIGSIAVYGGSENGFFATQPGNNGQVTNSLFLYESNCNSSPCGSNLATPMNSSQTFRNSPVPGMVLESVQQLYATLDACPCDIIVNPFDPTIVFETSHTYCVNGPMNGNMVTMLMSSTLPIVIKVPSITNVVMNMVGGLPQVDSGRIFWLVGKGQYTYVVSKDVGGLQMGNFLLLEGGSNIIYPVDIYGRIFVMSTSNELGIIVSGNATIHGLNC